MTPHSISQSLDVTEFMYANWLDGIPDCTSSQYHNQKFKTRCESVGLICLRHPQRRYGWAVTELSPELVSFVGEMGIDESCFHVFRALPKSSREVVSNEDEPLTGEPAPRTGSKLKKWSCGCTNIRAAVEVDATCGRCFRQFCRAEVTTR